MLTRHDGPVPLTPTQHVVVCLVLAAAFNVLQYREQLPLAYLHSGSSLPTPVQGELLTATLHLRMSFAHRGVLQKNTYGHPRLVVGDSMVRNYAGPHDLLMGAGWCAEELLPQLEQLLTDNNRQYESIVLWVGSALSKAHCGKEAEPYTAATREMIRVAEAHAKRVIVLSPNPAVHVTRSGNVIDTTGLCRTATRDLEAVLVSLHSNACYVNVLEFRERAMLGGMAAAYYLDGFHLSDAGMRAMMDEIERARPFAENRSDLRPSYTTSNGSNVQLPSRLFRENAGANAASAAGWSPT